MESDRSKVKVLYISGFERSGSTLLTKALGELDDTFAAGELRAIWWTSYLKNQLCGCGEPFRECPVWREVTERVFGGFEQVDFEWMTNHRPRRRHAPLLLLPAARPVVSLQFRRFIATLDRLYSAIARVTDSRIIVDESKTPLYCGLLRAVPSIDLYVVHLIRDPHGVHTSNLRLKHRGDPRLQRYNALTGMMLWNMLNVYQEFLDPVEKSHYMRLRYEDFVTDPVSSVERIKTLIGESDIGSPRIEGRHILLHKNHVMSGNHNRMEVGAIPLRSAEAWRGEIDPRTRSAVTCLSFPLLRHYGYA